MHEIVELVFSIDCDKSFTAKKVYIKDIIKSKEQNRWKATYLMFSSPKKQLTSVSTAGGTMLRISQICLKEYGPL